MKKYFQDWNTWEKTWLAVSALLMIALSVHWQASWISLVASLTGIITVVLVAKGRISNYYFGLVNVVAYAYVAYQWQYYGEVMLNILYFLPMQVYGLWYWKKNEKETDKVYVKKMSNQQRISWSIVAVVAIAGYGLFLQQIGGSLPFRDAITTVLSVIAMYLMARLYIEQWVLWIVVDVFTIYLWVATLTQGGSDIAVLIMWIAYLINAIYGLWHWIKLYKEQ